MSPSVNFFDIASDLPGSRQSWSPNTLKTRIALNYKQIPYTQTFVSYPDIAPLLRSLDIPQNTIAGQATYCFPAIALTNSSSQTPKAINQSFTIADTIEREFPSTPSLFPTPASRALALMTDELLVSLRPTASPLIHPYIPAILDSRGQAYFKRTKVEKLAFPDDVDAAWDKLAKGLQVFVTILQDEPTSGERGPFLEGDGKTFGYADAVLVAFMAWFERGHKEIWARMLKLGEGELGKLWEASEQWVEGHGEDKEWDWEGKGGKPEHEGE